MDYNEEIPFEKRPAPGFYDTSEDVLDLDRPNFRRLRFNDVRGPRRDDEEEVSVPSAVCVCE